MCGVLGYYNSELLDKKKKKCLRRAFAELDTRGKHASGIAGAINDKLWFIKDAVASSTLVTYKPYQEIVSTTNCGILHSRFTTQGTEKENKNNHPFIDKMFDDSVLSMVHNGVINNYDTLAKRFKLESEIETDSFVIVHMIKRFYEKYNDMETAITHAVRWLGGSFVLLFLHVTKDQAPVMYFLKHNNPLTIFDYHGCKILGSTQAILGKGFKWDKEYTLEEDTLYKLDGRPDVYIANKLTIYKPIVKKYTYTTYPSYAHTTYYGSTFNFKGSDPEDYKWCSECRTTKKGSEWNDKHYKMICPDCLAKLDKPKPADVVCVVCEDKEKATNYYETVNACLCRDCALDFADEVEELHGLGGKEGIDERLRDAWEYC